MQRKRYVLTWGKYDQMFGVKTAVGYKITLIVTLTH